MKRALSFFALLVVAACSSGSDPATPAPDPSGGASSSGGTTPGDGSAPSETSTTFGSYVILGDSISDRGGSGPFFYDLLGDDLKAKLGDVKVVKNSQSGARSIGLPEQVSTLPATLTGPVAVSVTIGGNDMQAAALDILNGNDEKARTAFTENVTKAYDELTRAGRFGEGVKVTIFHATIYDPTDGEGNFGEAGCPGYLALLPKQPTRGYWDNWNNAAAEVLKKYGDAVVTVDMRAKFDGHGVGKLKDGTSWFDPDCIHPNTTGHDEIRKLFFGAIAP